MKHILTPLLTAAIILSLSTTATAHRIALPALPHGVVAADNQVTRPAGHPRGWILLIHGGGWQVTGPQSLAPSYAAWLNANGWAVYDIDYRPGIDSYSDSLAAYDRLRGTEGPQTPICIVGSSAGATIALWIAAERSDVTCVLSEGAVTDLRAYASDSDPTHSWLLGKFIRTTFGTQLWRYSPARVAPLIRCPVLAAGASTDLLVSETRQLSELAAANPRVQTTLVPGVAPAGMNFTHATVSEATLAVYQQRELAFFAASRRVRA
jgi:acetyl esterase/lipase